MINFLKSMLSGTDDSISTMRVLVVAILLDLFSLHTAQNIISMIAGHGYVDFPPNTVSVILVVLGAKVGQSVSENLKKG